MSQSLRHKSINGVIWSAIERFSTQAVSFCLGLLLARLLTPDDYGTVALLTIFFSISQCFVDSGITTALIRKKDRTESDKSTAFYFNIGVALFAYIVLFILAPYIADFFEIPILSQIMRVSALTIPIGSFSNVQMAQLSYNLDFKSQAKVSVSKTLISGIVGVALALNGFGVWSLVFQSLTAAFIGSFMLWILVKWRPKMPFSKKSFAELFGFGSKLLASGLLDTIYNNVYGLVIGKFFSATDLGLYSRAQQYAAFPSSNITGVLQKVTFPVLCEIQDDDERLRINYRKIIRISAFIVFPLMMGLSALAEPAIVTILTTKWIGAVILLEVICFSMMWYPIHAINLNLLQVKGRSDLFLHLEIIKKILGVAVLCATLPFGLLAMCYGKILTSIICLVINTHYTGKLINVGFIIQMRDIAPSLISSLIMWGLVRCVTPFIDSNIFKILCGVSLGGTFYLASAYFTKSEDLSAILEIIKSKRKK